MNIHRTLSSAIAGLLLLVGAPVPAKPPATWDGLVQVKAKRLDLAYLQPGADFRVYTKVILEPTEVAFQRNWQREHNQSSPLTRRISNTDVEDAVTKGAAEAAGIFSEEWSKGGYAVVNEPGPDVLRIKTGIVNIWVNAPDVPSPGRSMSFAPEAGRATFFIEARDSMTGALLGRAVDQRYAGDTPMGWRSSMSNRADFRDLVASWAKDGVRGLNELKALSPVRP